MDRRHAPVGRLGRERGAGTGVGLVHVARGRQRQTRDGVLASDQPGGRVGGRFRWLLSTLLAATVGAVGIGVVIIGSLDPEDSADGLVPALKRSAEPGPIGLRAPRPRVGLAWSSPKADRLQIASGAPSARHIIHDSLRRRRGGRGYIEQKPYARVVFRLDNVQPDSSQRIPAFNPYRLYSSSGKQGSESEGPTNAEHVSSRVVELIGGLLPEEDGQELDAGEVAELVTRIESDEIRPAFQAEGSERVLLPPTAAERRAAAIPEAIPPNTTVLGKTKASDNGEEAADDIDQREVRVVKVAQGETLSRVLMRGGVDHWSARALAVAAREVVPDASLKVGDEVHLTLVASPADPSTFEVSHFSVFTEGIGHKGTVYRNDAGEFIASTSPQMPRVVPLATRHDETTPVSSASLYANIYQACLSQGLDHERIMLILRLHARETDYRRRVRAGDTLELFFDLGDDERGVDAPLGELLASMLTVGGQTTRFFRFRAQDGSIDYYDLEGHNSRQFLLRRPVRGAEVRFTSGFGIRRHPILNVRRMHTGVDWSAPTGTPILAAGNGTIEEADRKGQYGNYVRLRHANGYQTTYAHMSRIAEGVRPGGRVRQGQVIGYVGSTGLSSGPHLHYEVLINNSFVDPMRIEVPRERRLAGRDINEFHRERLRIEELLRRQPVVTRMAETRSR
jgi:murein DD-endopeptidase MepM/ murein hydrolase activator NlpD